MHILFQAYSAVWNKWNRKLPYDWSENEDDKKESVEEEIENIVTKTNSTVPKEAEDDDDDNSPKKNLVKKARKKVIIWRKTVNICSCTSIFDNCWPTKAKADIAFAQLIQNIEVG